MSLIINSFTGHKNNPPINTPNEKIVALHSMINIIRSNVFGNMDCKIFVLVFILLIMVELCIIVLLCFDMMCFLGVCKTN